MRSPALYWRLTLVATGLTLLCGCGATPTMTPVPPPTATSVPPPTSTPVPPVPAPAGAVLATPAPPKFPGVALVDVGGYSLSMKCAGTGSPIIILDHGLGAPPGYWDGVYNPVSLKAQVCAYDRAGSGASGKSPKSPRTSLDMVADLHALLSKANLKPPYILVGHSLGGFNVRLYASRYPQEVAGMVLVDSMHTDQLTTQLTFLPPKSSNENEALATVRGMWAEGVMRNLPIEGGVDLMTSAEQAKAAGKLGNIPLAVVSASPNSRSDLPPGFPEDLWAKWSQQWSTWQKDMLSLSSNSTQVVAATSGHMIPIFDPALVTDAILSVLKQVQGK